MISFNQEPPAARNLCLILLVNFRHFPLESLRVKLHGRLCSLPRCQYLLVVGKDRGIAHSGLYLAFQTILLGLCCSSCDLRLSLLLCELRQTILFDLGFGGNPKVRVVVAAR